MSQSIYSIGHSNHSVERFIQLLVENRITAVADVRSSPVSRFSPQFDSSALKNSLREHNCAYVFLGRELGGRPKSTKLYTDGAADYELMTQTREFAKGIARLLEGSKTHRIAIMCSESDPLDCHRCLLVGRSLSIKGINTVHILSDGQKISQLEIDEQLLRLEQGNNEDLFLSERDQIALAYRKRAKRVAYREQSEDPENRIAAE